MVHWPTRKSTSGSDAGEERAAGVAVVDVVEEEEDDVVVVVVVVSASSSGWIVADFGWNYSVGFYNPSLEILNQLV